MWGISVGKTKRVEIVVTELFDWSYTKKMQPTNFEVSHFEPYPGDEKKKGGTSRSPKVWNFTAT